MTDLATALANAPGKLAPFEGRDVLRSTVAVTNAGDGLSQAMKLDPIELHHGSTVYLVLECEVSKVRFDPIKDTDALARVHVLRAGTATLVDADLVKKQLDEQRDKIQRAKDAARGQGRMDDELTDTLLREHHDGEHVELVAGCPECDAEVEAKAVEAATAAPKKARRSRKAQA